MQISISTLIKEEKKNLQNETKITPYNIFMYFSFTYNSISTLVHLFRIQQSKGVCSARSYTNHANLSEIRREYSD